MHKCHIQIKWSTHPDAVPVDLVVSSSFSKAHAMCAYSSAQGQGWVDRLDVSSDLAIYQLVHRFDGNQHDDLLPLGEFRLGFSEPSLTVHTLHSGLALQRDRQSNADLSLTPGNDLFRHGSECQFTPILDTAEDVKMTALVATDQALRQLLGEDVTQQLLSNLELLEAPNTKLASIPRVITEPLRHCLSSGCAGPLHTLYAQSKILEYLWKLATFVAGNRLSRSTGSRSSNTVHALRDYLLNLEGAMPTLLDLAKMFGESPQSLNKHFAREYGQTIYAMVSNHRLNQAHKALAESGMPIKAIASRLGYSHVNHFTHAFKAKFGYTPGSLRRTQGRA